MKLLMSVVLSSMFVAQASFASVQFKRSDDPEANYKTSDQLQQQQVLTDTFNNLPCQRKSSVDLYANTNGKSSTTGYKSYTPVSQ